MKYFKNKTTVKIGKKIEWDSEKRKIYSRRPQDKKT